MTKSKGGGGGGGGGGGLELIPGGLEGGDGGEGGGEGKFSSTICKSKKAVHGKKFMERSAWKEVHGKKEAEEYADR